MLKRVLTSLAVLFGTTLSAETIGDAQFQFPPSQYEWKLLIDQELFNQFEDDDEDDEEYYETEECENSLKLYVHREGDALELFTAAQFYCDEDDDQDFQDPETVAKKQQEVFDEINPFLPNHKFNLLAISSTHIDNVKEYDMEWELNDGVIDLLYGFSKIVKNEEKITLFNYFTTAQRTEENRALWIEVLNNAR